MKPTTLLTRNGSKRASHAVGSGLQRQLIDAVMGLGRQGAALAGLEVHHVVADPGDVATAMVFQHPLAAFAQECQADAEAGVGGLGAGDRLKQQVHRRAAFQAGQLRGDVGQAAGLRRRAAARRSGGRGRAGSRRRCPPIRSAGLTPITASPQPKSRPSTAESRMPPRSSAGWFGCTRMPRTPRWPIVLRQRVTLRILLRGQDQVLVAHQLGDRRRDLRRDRPVQAVQLGFR